MTALPQGDLCKTHRSPLPRKKTFDFVPFAPLAGRCRRQRVAPLLVAYLVAGGGPPLCHSVTSPPARGGEGNHEFFKGLHKGRFVPSFDYGLLGFEHFFERLFGGGDHLTELVGGEGLAFGGSLDFDEACIVEADDVAIDVGG